MTHERALRICVVAETYPLVSETFVRTQVEGLAARGHEVEVLCSEVRRGPDETETVVRRRWGALSAANGPVDRLPSAVRHRAVGLMDRLDTRHLEKFDIVLAQFGYQGARVAAALRGSRRAPPLVTIYHGHDVATVAHDGAMWIYDRLFRTGALHLPVNDAFRDILVAAGAPPDRTRVHRMGISPDTFRFRARDWTQRPLRLLTVGRLTQKKGIGDAIRALEVLSERRPGLDWRHEIVGTGELDGALRAQAAASAVGDRIRFLGARPHAEVRRRLETAQVVLLPSVTATNGDAEGVPVSLMEAMASGALVVSTRHSGIPDLVEDGVTGFLAPEGDAAALADRIAAAAGAGNAAEIARAAREKVRRDFDADRQLDRLEKMLVAQRRPDRHARTPVAGPSGRAAGTP
jgi:colanic acid/amylovoran biosynthesis glycosyltransferase